MTNASPAHENTELLSRAVRLTVSSTHGPLQQALRSFQDSLEPDQERSFLAQSTSPEKAAVFVLTKEIHDANVKNTDMCWRAALHFPGTRAAVFFCSRYLCVLQPWNCSAGFREWQAHLPGKPPLAAAYICILSAPDRQQLLLLF